MLQFRWVNKDIVSRIARRFSIVDNPTVQNPLALSPLIQPVTDYDRLLATPAVKDEVIVSVNNNVVYALEVPSGKRWLVHAFEALRSTGDRTLKYFGIYIENVTMNLSNQAAAPTTFVCSGPIAPFYVDEGGKFYVQFANAGTTDGNWNVRAIIEEEDAYD